MFHTWKINIKLNNKKSKKQKKKKTKKTFKKMQIDQNLKN